MHVYGRGADTRDVANLYDAVLATESPPPDDATQIVWLYEFERIRQRSDSGSTITDATDEVFTAYWV